MRRPAGIPSRAPANGALAALDLLASAVLLVGADGRIRYANAAAEHLLDSSRKALARLKLPALFVNGTELARLCEQALAHNYADLRQDLTLERGGREPLHVHRWAASAAPPSCSSSSCPTSTWSSCANTPR
jgi:two-component system nitrogen regulation sensor histidine kinase GlnL